MGGQEVDQGVETSPLRRVSVKETRGSSWSKRCGVRRVMKIKQGGIEQNTSCCIWIKL